MAVSGTEAKEQDVALGALDALSEATTSSIEGLNEVNEQFTVAKRRRRVGWSWQRIVSSTDLPSALSAVARTTADLGRERRVPPLAGAGTTRGGYPLGRYRSLLGRLPPASRCSDPVEEDRER